MARTIIQLKSSVVSQPPIAAIFVEAAVHLGFLLALALTLHAETGERERGQAGFGDVALAVFAHAVGAVIDAADGFVDGLHLVAVAVGEDAADLAVARIAGEVIGIHALVLLLIAPVAQILADVAQELGAHRFEGFPRLL